LNKRKKTFLHFRSTSQQTN